VDPGNLVNADTTLLTTVVTVNPMYAYFDVDERTYLSLVKTATANSDASFSGLQSPVLMALANEEDFSQAGTVNFLDNRLSGNTGTIRMRGVFENKKEILKAGLFVRIRLPVASPYRAILVSDEALQSDQGRKFVWVVNEENKVEYRDVKLGHAIGGLRVIKEGLSGTERVIVSGMQRAQQGAQVKVETQDPPKAPESPWAKLLARGRSRMTR
jgi:RND family efflux transporter MFP subunit